MKLLSVLSTSFDSAKRLVIKAWNGKSDTRTAKQYAPYGLDSNPIKSRVALYGRTELDGAETIIGYLNVDCISEPGEIRLFSTDSGGVFKFNIRLKSDGTVLIGDSNNDGAFTDFAVKYNELKLETDKTKAYILALRNATQTALVAVDGLIPGTSAAFIATMGALAPGDISTSKNDKVKFN